MGIQGLNKWIEKNINKIKDVKNLINCLLESIFLPDSIKIIGDQAFSSCTKLKIIEINENSLLKDILNIVDGYGKIIMVPVKLKTNCEF